MPAFYLATHVQKQGGTLEFCFVFLPHVFGWHICSVVLLVRLRNPDSVLRLRFTNQTRYNSNGGGGGACTIFVVVSGYLAGTFAMRYAY